MTRLGKFASMAAGVALIIGVAAAAEDQKMMMADASLYERLGGYDVISAVVDEATERVMADDRVNQDHKAEALPKLKQLLTLQVCEATGGPCTYIGLDMAAAHRGMNITEEQFNISGGHLQGALAKFNVPEKEQNELLTLFGSMALDIIGK